MLAPEFASRIGRMDLSRTRIVAVPAAVSTSDRDSGLASAGAAAQVAAGAMSAGVGASFDSGSLSAATIAGAVLLIAAFYIWTRGHQA